VVGVADFIRFILLLDRLNDCGWANMFPFPPFITQFIIEDSSSSDSSVSVLSVSEAEELSTESEQSPLYS